MRPSGHYTMPFVSFGTWCETTVLCTVVVPLKSLVLLLLRTLLSRYAHVYLCRYLHLD